MSHNSQIKFLTFLKFELTLAAIKAMVALRGKHLNSLSTASTSSKDTQNFWKLNNFVGYTGFPLLFYQFLGYLGELRRFLRLFLGGFADSREIFTVEFERIGLPIF